MRKINKESLLVEIGNSCCELDSLRCNRKDLWNQMSVLSEFFEGRKVVPLLWLAVLIDPCHGSEWYLLLKHKISYLTEIFCATISTHFQNESVICFPPCISTANQDPVFYKVILICDIYLYYAAKIVSLCLQRVWELSFYNCWSPVQEGVMFFYTDIA